jgi:hypothetical protein
MTGDPEHLVLRKCFVLGLSGAAEVRHLRNSPPYREPALPINPLFNQFSPEQFNIKSYTFSPVTLEMK